MPEITADLLRDFPIEQYTTAETIRRGEVYYEEGRVRSLRFEASTYLFNVIGDGFTYQVEISHPSREKLRLTCTCPHARRVSICKHIVAAFFTLIDTLDKKTPKPWQQQLEGALDNYNAQAKSSAGRGQPYAAFFSLAQMDYYFGTEFQLKPNVLRASQWSGLKDLMHLSPDELNQWLVDNREWESYKSNPYQSLNTETCLNLSPQAATFFNFMVEQSRQSTRLDQYLAYLPMIVDLGFMVLMEDHIFGFTNRVHMQREPVQLCGVVQRGEEDIQIHPGIKLESHTKQFGEEDQFFLLSAKPAWVLAKDLLAPVSNPGGFEIIQFLPLTVPLEDEPFFLDEYLPNLVSKLPLEGTDLHFDENQADPVPRLYLKEDKQTLRAQLVFGYGEAEVNADEDPPQEQLSSQPGTWQVYRIRRQPKTEAQFYEALKTPAYRLKRAAGNLPFGSFELRARAHPFDFLMHSVPQLVKDGFEIYGEENIKSIKVNRSVPRINISISSGIDWFDLNVVVHYGDQEIGLKELRKAIKKGDNYVKLADGSIGQIPEEWLNKYKRLWGLAEEKGDAYRLSDLQLPLIDSLLAEEELNTLPAELKERRERLRNFSGIQAKPLPKGFTGELRPYQKAGFDWLYFLREYKFGGILADDMGLGKTIQVLAFLQSLKENHKSEKTTLLVVPKSLLTNWQREAARFTPELSFLEYTGSQRSLEEDQFKGTDVVITTYGIVLRDIEFLRAYTFHYVILDESQAIKNPMAKSAKAARLIKAEHRLCMTGTPVENNSFELWSQFAFLNPGLLGTLDYFREEFAVPIESEQNEEAAKILHSLVYPFILRRTKSQVAPELPPRSERVLYTDMDPRQLKLYNKTREKYRHELLNLIDKEGMNNTRMKILEGLLRLRQIAIHPGLMEKDYKGEVPKFELLLENLETLRAEGHKALVFSQFIETLKFLRFELDQRKIPYNYLDGQTRDRQEQVDSFQENPDIPFFLISLKAGGVGLNLTAADYVIHIDPWWNPAVEMQASDRAHRIGQDKPVFVYKLITRDTVEEKILLLQERKKALVESLITTESSFFKSLSAEDVQSLFGD